MSKGSKVKVLFTIQAKLYGLQGEVIRKTVSLQVNYAKRSSFDFLTHLEFSLFANLKNTLQTPWGNLQCSYRLLQYSMQETSPTSCFNFLTSCSVLSVVIGGLFVLANCNAQNRTEQDRTGQDRTEQNRTEQNRTEQNRTGQDRTEQNRTEQNRTEQNRTEQNRTEQEVRNL